MVTGSGGRLVRLTGSHRSLGPAGRVTLAGSGDQRGILQDLMNGFVQDALRLGKKKALQVWLIHTDETTGSCGPISNVAECPEIESSRTPE